MAEYDIVIAGSGLGGLECGNILSKEGYKVCVLEKNRQIGGALQIFSRDKVIFDTGIHYIGGLDKGQNLYQYFKFMGLMDKLKLRKMNEDGFDLITFDDDKEEYKYAQGYENFIDTLAEKFPNEREALKKYCDKLKEVTDYFPLYRLDLSKQNPTDTRYLDINAKAYIESITQNEKLRSVLAATNMLYGGEGDKTPLYVHASCLCSYIESSWKCVDGGAQIGTLLAKGIKDNGGDIFNYSEVSKFVMEGDRIRAVKLSDGREIEGKSFISNLHPALTLDMVDSDKIKKSYRNRIKSLDNTISSFIISVVLKENTFEYMNYNNYHHKSDKVWESTEYKEDLWPDYYAVFTGAGSKTALYADHAVIMCYMKYDEVKKWSDSYNVIPNHITHRGDDYEAFKMMKAEKAIEEVGKRYPGFKQKIKSYYVSTPLSYRDYTSTPNGSIYGILKDYSNPLKSFVSPQTKIPNLYFTGQNVNLHGVLGVTISAVRTSAEYLGYDYLMKKIISA